jgi:hypothetical protein
MVTTCPGVPINSRLQFLTPTSVAHRCMYYFKWGPGERPIPAAVFRFLLELLQSARWPERRGEHFQLIRYPGHIRRTT